jgi:uncharacterized protein YbjT (DUF2867 family)
MNIIVGATGQVGSHVIQRLKQDGYATRAMVRNKEKVADKNNDYRVADLFDAEQLIEAFQGGETALVITPENPASKDILEDTRRIAHNYVSAIQATGIKKVVALSCIGAHIRSNTGNVLMSRILEQELDSLDIAKVYIRPSYYFSNWLSYLDTVKQYGILPSFFPEELKLDMHSPIDLAKFIGQVMIRPTSSDKEIYELTGPQQYSPHDVANAFSTVLKKKVAAQAIPVAQWREKLMAVGFTDNTAANLSDMTQAVIDGKLVPEWPGKVVKLNTSLERYMEEQLKKQE